MAGSTTIVAFDIRGVDEAMRNLKDLDEKIRRRIVTAAVRAGSRVIIKEARARAPRRTGKLAKNIRATVNRDRITGTIKARIRPKPTKAQKAAGKGAWYAHMVIGGTKPHRIPRDDETRGSKYIKIGPNQYRYSADHPGIQGNNFMEQAASAAFQPSLIAFRHKYTEQLDREVLKLPKTV